MSSAKAKAKDAADLFSRVEAILRKPAVGALNEFQDWTDPIRTSHLGSHSKRQSTHSMYALPDMPRPDHVPV